ncbi:hypothetical protein [Streptomyces sp. UG1]|uniref:hypothetical protein n=1 Tax=Streptomyces sp. UG1 TaxID=3417652 RepID=UPI003CF5A85B
MAIITTAGVSTSTPAAQDQRDDAEILAAITRECERHGLALQTVDTTDDGLAEMQVINGRRTLVVPQSDDLAETLDDFLLIGRCVDCRKPADDTTTPYYPGYDHIDGSPIMICQSCRDKRTARANAPDRLAVSRCWDAIEAVFRTSANTEMTRKALREFVDMTADQAKPGVTA